MELAFETKNYTIKMNKNATIYSNDPNNPKYTIRLSANIDAVPDTTLSIAYSPSKFTFTQDERKFKVNIDNICDQVLAFTQESPDIENLKVRLSANEIKPGKSAAIDFEWSGEYEKENIEKSLTFQFMYPQHIDRITIPLVIAGTDPTPKSVKRAVPPKPKVMTKENTQQIQSIAPSGTESKAAQTKKEAVDKSADGSGQK